MTMLAQEINAMWAADAASEWEQLNAPDPHEAEKQQAAKTLEAAIRLLSEAEDIVQQAAYEVEGLPAEDRIGSFIESLGDMRHGIGDLAEKLRRCDV